MIETGMDSARQNFPLPMKFGRQVQQKPLVLDWR